MQRMKNKTFNEKARQDVIESLAKKEDVLQAVNAAKKMKNARAAIQEVVESLRKHHLGRYRVVGRIQYGEMVADAKIILEYHGILPKEKRTEQRNYEK